MCNQEAIYVPRFHQFFWDTLYEGWFGCKDFPRQGYIYWGEASPQMSYLPPPPRKKNVFPEKN